MQTVTIYSTKYDGSLHRRHQAILLDEGPWGWLTYCQPQARVESYNGTYISRHPFLRWHWRDDWWDAMLVFDSQGRWLEWYCNVVTPPQFKDNVLAYHDLDLDVIWHREKGLLIDDADEFERHAVQMNYPASLIQQAWDTAQRVRRRMKQGEWRFAEDPLTIEFKKEIALWRDRLT